MNDTRRKILSLAVVFLPVFGICLLSYSHVQPPYQRAVVAAVDVGLHQLDPPMRIEIREDGGWATFTLLPDGTETPYWSRPGENLTLFYVGLALLPALLLATPVGLRRRVRLLLIGLLLLFVLQVLAAFGLVLSIRGLAGDPDSPIWIWGKTVGNTFGQVSAFVIWGILTWQVWFSGAVTTEDPAATRSSHTIGHGVLIRNPAMTVACLLAAVLLFAAYADHFDNEFHFGDSDLIVDNLSIRSLRNTGEFFTDPHTLTTRPQDAEYRPLLTLSHAVDHWTGGDLRARPFRRTQFALLLLLGVGLALLFRRLLDLGRSDPAHRYAALFAALLFCVHVANTGTVNDLSARSDLLGALGITAAFWLYLRLPGRRGTYLCLLPMLVGALAEPLTLLFAPLLVVFVWLFEEQRSIGALLRRSEWKRFGSVLGRCSPALVSGLIMLVLVHGMGESTGSSVASTGWSHWIDPPFAWFRHAWTYLFPVGGPAFSGWGLLAARPALRGLIGAIFLIALAVAIDRFSRRRTLRPIAFGLAWFALASLAVSSQGPSVDGRLLNPAFLPYIGLTLALVGGGAWGLRELRDRGIPAVRPIAASLAVAIVTLHAVATHRLNPIWQDDEALWAAVLHHDAEDARAQLNHGRALLARGGDGDASGALEALERARIALGDSSRLEHNLALARVALGQDAQAEDHFRQALRLDPRDAETRHALARWMVTRARGPEALEQLQLAAEVRPNAGEIRHLLMNLHAASGNEPALQAAADGTLAILPTDEVALAYASDRIPIRASVETADAYATLASRNAEARFWLDAAVIYRHAVKLDPGSAELRNYLGWTRMQLGFHEGAIAAYLRALEIEPASAHIWNDLGWAQVQSGHIEAAVASFERAVALDPSMSRARRNRDWARRQSASSGATE